jgi:putative phosphoesterase
VASPPRRIGLISDTHGLLREEAVQALRGSDLILHAGDVGKPEIIDALRTVAPVVAVRGNVDRDSWASALPSTAVAETESALIYVLHDLKELDLDPVAAGFRVVVSGHSHKPARSRRSGTLYINPGSAGPKRFNLPTTIARLDLGTSPWKIDFVDILSGRVLSPAEVERS